MMKIACFEILMLLIHFSDLAAQGIWTQKTNYPGYAIYSSVGFTLNDKGYIGTGANAIDLKFREFYEYDPVTDSWTQKANFPGTRRQYAIGFAIANYGFIGTGLDTNGACSDFWKYDPSINLWNQISNVPGLPRATATSFTYSGKGYVGTGGNGITAFDDFWEYDPISDTWLAISNFAGVARGDIDRGPFVLNGKAYLGTGFTASAVAMDDFWEYDLQNNTWSQKANFTGGPRYGCTGFALCDKGYLGFGRNNAIIYDDLYQYDPISNTWIFDSAIPIPRVDAPVFVIGNKAYIGPGNAGKDFWEFSPDSCNTASVNNIINELKVVISPNPFSYRTQITLPSIDLSNASITIYYQSGKKVKEIEHISNQKLFFMKDDLKAGTYILKLSQNQKVLSVAKITIID